MPAAVDRARQFAARFGLERPVVLAPMAGVPALALPLAVARAGGLASVGALLFDAAAITDWIARFRASAGATAPLLVNLWVPDPPPHRDAVHEAAVTAFLSRFGPPPPAGAADTPLQDFDAQCAALVAARPAIASSVMGLFPPAVVEALKAAGIAWFATVTTLAEAIAAETAGADALVVQGAEAGGHRGAFDAAPARDRAVGTLALLPQVVDAVRLPVVAAGGIADARGVAAALVLGASAVAIGTGYLRTPEAGIAPVWADALAHLKPEHTRLTRVFSGRWGRAIENDVVRAADAAEAPAPAPYPVQRGLSAAMRKAAETAGDLHAMQAWAGQAAALASPEPAEALTRRLWDEAQALLGG